MAAPSRRWAARMPSISVAFLTAFGAAAHRSTGRGDDPREAVGGRRLIETDGPSAGGEGRESRLEVDRFARFSQLFQAVAGGVAELASVDEDGRAALAWDQREAERERRVRDVGAANVEGPGECVRVRDDERVVAAVGDLLADPGQLVLGRLAGMGDVVQDNGAAWWLRPVGPGRIDRIVVQRDEAGARGRAGFSQPLGTVDGVQPRVITKPRARREIGLDPAFRRGLDQVGDREQTGVDLRRGLQGVAAVNEQDRAVGQHDRGAGGAGEARQPSQSLLGRRDIFILMAIGARKDETVDAAPLQFCPQLRKPPGKRRTVDIVIESLETGLEHCRTLWAGAVTDNGSQARACHDRAGSTGFAPLCALQRRAVQEARLCTASTVKILEMQRFMRRLQGRHAISGIFARAKSSILHCRKQEGRRERSRASNHEDDDNGHCNSHRPDPRRPRRRRQAGGVLQALVRGARRGAHAAGRVRNEALSPPHSAERGEGGRLRGDREERSGAAFRTLNAAY
jgi:hypothetical protein